MSTKINVLRGIVLLWVFVFLFGVNHIFLDENGSSESKNGPRDHSIGTSETMNVTAVLVTPYFTGKDYPHTEQYILDLCWNKSLEDTANCLYGEMLKFYWVNITSYGPDIPYNYSFQHILKYGGACYNYNLLYAKLAGELKFSSTDASIYLSQNGHYFTIIYDNSGYCIMDQIYKPKCEIFRPDEPINKSLYDENQILNKVGWTVNGYN